MVEPPEDRLVSRTDGSYISAGSTTGGLSDSAIDYCYEFSALCHTLDQVLDLSASGRVPRADVRLCNAMLEANLVHVRVLTSFFFPTLKKPDDVTAEGFLGEPMPAGGTEANRMVKVRGILDKRLAHLTTERRKGHEGYDLILIAGDLLTLHQQFIRRMIELNRDCRPFDHIHTDALVFNERHGHTYKWRIDDLENGQ